MTEQSSVLDYATPPPRRSARSLVTPKNIAIAGAVAAVVSLMVPFNIGSGRVIVHPLRFLGCAVAVGCAVLYALLRLWRDPVASGVRRIVLSLCLLIALWSFVTGHLSVWGRTRLPPFEMRFDYWRWISVTAAAVILACMFCGISAVLRLVGLRANPPIQRTGAAVSLQML